MSLLQPSFAGQGKLSDRHLLANVFVIRSSELGTHDNYIHCKTHLGHQLHEGDAVLGFDLRNANINDAHFNKMSPDKVCFFYLKRNMMYSILHEDVPVAYQATD